MKIKTEYISAIDLWTAIEEDSYDGAFDSPTRFQMGKGSTEEDAVNDLKNLLSEGI